MFVLGFFIEDPCLSGPVEPTASLPPSLERRGSLSSREGRCLEILGKARCGGSGMAPQSIEIVENGNENGARAGRTGVSARRSRSTLQQVLRCRLIGDEA